MDLELKGKVAVVTGGSDGIGLAVARAFAREGANTLICARTGKALRAAAEAIRAEFSTNSVAVEADVTSTGDIERVCRAAETELGGADFLINNAGTTWGAPAQEHPLAAWNKVLDLNLTGLFLLTQRVANASMIPRRSGRIVNVASVAGLRGNNPKMMGTIAYSTSKGGVISMTRALAVEWARYGITVNAIAPGYFPTKMTRGTLEQARELIEEATPLGRTGGPEDLKGVAVLLASDASAFITGQTIAVDGGVTAR